MNATLYSTNCPKCVILEKKLQSKNIKYSVEHDVDLMVARGFTSIPMLEIDGDLLTFKEAVDWIDDME